MMTTATLFSLTIVMIIMITMWSSPGAVVYSAEEKNMLDNKIREKIIDAVHKEHGWKTNEVRVDEIDRLRHGSCSFYTAGHTVRPLSYQLNYAVLSGDVVVSTSDDQALTKILKACGSDAPAGWWAEVITDFHQELGSGVVLHDARQNAGAVRKVQDAKRDFVPPAFAQEGGGAHKTVKYYLLDPEAFIVYWVEAIENKDGSISVSKKQVG